MVLREVFQMRGLMQVIYVSMRPKHLPFKQVLDLAVPPVNHQGMYLMKK